MKHIIEQDLFEESTYGKSCSDCKNWKQAEGSTLYGYCESKKTGVNSFGKVCGLS